MKSVVTTDWTGKYGEVTKYAKTEYNSIGEIHSVPLTEAEYLSDMKKVKEALKQQVKEAIEK